MRVLLDDVIETDDGQFDLVWGGDGAGFVGNWDTFFAGQVNGLAGAANPDGLYLNLGRRSGGSQVRIELCDGEPAEDDTWEDVVEVSVQIPPGASVWWTTWGGDGGDGTFDLDPGSYRVRVNARGRDAGAEDEFAEEVVDFYLVLFWPSPQRPDAILRTTSETARYWHNSVGSRR